MNGRAAEHFHPLSSDEAGWVHGQTWVDAWNAHDLERIMALYAEPLRFHSPLIVLRTGRKDGFISDLGSLRAYFSRGLSEQFGRGLSEQPAPHFALEATLRGVNSLVVLYRSHRGRTAEVMSFDDRGRIVETRVHYLPGLL